MSAYSSRNDSSPRASAGARRVAVFTSIGIVREIWSRRPFSTSSAWSRRLQLVHAGLQNGGGFPARVAKYLSKKYGYSPEAGAAYGTRVTELLGMLGARLRAQREAGSRYYVGDALTAVDVYSATFTAMFNPLPPEHCQMDVSVRQAFETRDAQIKSGEPPSDCADADTGPPAPGISRRSAGTLRRARF
jgi:hypothetical protein